MDSVPLKHLSQIRGPLQFNAFEDEIERLATDDYSTEIWQIAKQCDARGVTQLQNTMVWIAAEMLAYKFARHFTKKDDEPEAELEIDGGDTNEN